VRAEAFEEEKEEVCRNGVIIVSLNEVVVVNEESNDVTGEAVVQRSSSCWWEQFTRSPSANREMGVETQYDEVDDEARGAEEAKSQGVDGAGEVKAAEKNSEEYFLIFL
jgi:hypothetical protein